jgi:hypothetical protein
MGFRHHEQGIAFPSKNISPFKQMRARLNYYLFV